jgi:hypothetical protein
MRRSLLLLSLVAAGCSSSPIAGPDGGSDLAAAHSDAAVGADLAVAAGADLASADLATAASADLAIHAGTDLAAGGCAGTIAVAVDNGGLEHFDSICNGSWGANQTTGALGYLFSGGPFPGVQTLDIEGCVSANANSEGLLIALDKAMAPGKYTKGSVTYTDKNGVAWGVANDPLSVTVTRFDAVGGVIEGSFNATVTHGGNAAHSLGGTFHVCRVSDELAP